MLKNPSKMPGSEPEAYNIQNLISPSLSTDTSGDKIFVKFRSVVLRKVAHRPHVYAGQECMHARNVRNYRSYNDSQLQHLLHGSHSKNILFC